MLVIVLIVIIILLILLCMGLAQHNKDNTAAFLEENDKANVRYHEQLSQQSEQFCKFVGQSREDLQKLEEGHKEIIDNYEQDFLTKAENEVAMRATVQLTQEYLADTTRQRDILFEAYQMHVEKCLPDAAKGEFHDEIQEVVNAIQDEKSWVNT